MNWKLLWRKRDGLTPGEAATKRKVYIFVVCVVCSAVFWLFIKLSQENQSLFSRSVVFEDVPEGMVIAGQSDSVIHYMLETTGVRLIQAGLFSTGEALRLEIPSLPSLQRNGRRVHYLSNTLARERLQEEANPWERITQVNPDTVFIELAPSATKRIPVELQADITFEPRFDQYGELEISPDSVQLTGPKTVLDTLSRLQTVRWEARNLRQTTRARLDIALPENIPSLELDVKQVSVEVPIAEFTESSLELPIQVVCPEGIIPRDIRLFPSRVTVSYLVALQDYAAVDQEMFEVVVSCPETPGLSGERLPVRLENHPGFVQILYISPANVEYLILE